MPTLVDPAPGRDRARASSCSGELIDRPGRGQRPRPHRRRRLPQARPLLHRGGRTAPGRGPRVGQRHLRRRRAHRRPHRGRARAQVVIGDYELSLKAQAPARRPPARAPAPGSQSPTAQRASVASGPLYPREPLGGPQGAGRRSGQREAAPPSRAGAVLPWRRSVASRPGAQVITGPTLRGLTGPWANKLYPIRDTVVVGRVAGVQIQLEDESVSRRHAELERTADGVVCGT